MSPANDSDSTNTTIELVPTPNDDAIIGYTTLDLSIFLRGLHLAGVFNVFDFNGRITGRLELQAKPADDWYVQYMMEKLWQTTHNQQANMANKTNLTLAAASATTTTTPAATTTTAAAAAAASAWRRSSSISRRSTFLILFSFPTWMRKHTRMYN